MMNEIKHGIYRFDIHGPLEELAQALKVGFRSGFDSTYYAVGYMVDETGDIPKLIFCKDTELGMIRFFTKFSAEDLTEMVKKWCVAAAESTVDPYSGSDGSSEVGFRVFNESWGIVNNKEGAFCAVEPAWIYYGK